MKKKLVFTFFIVTNVFFTQNDSLKSTENLNDGENKVVTLNKISEKYRETQIDSAIYYAKNALEIAKINNYKKGIITSYINLAESYNKKKMFLVSNEMGSQALRIVSNSKNYLLQGDIYNLIARNYEGLGNEKEGLKHLFLAEGNYVKTEEISVRKILNYNDLANQYILQDNYIEALENLKKAQGIANSPIYNRQLADTYTVLSFLYYKQHEFSNALLYSNLALDIYKETNNQKGINSTSSNIADIYFGLKDYKNSELMSVKLLSIDNEFIKSTSYLLLSKIALKYKDYKLAYKHVLKAEEAAKKTKSKYKMLYVAFDKAIIIGKLNRKKEAIQLMRQAIEDAKAINNVELQKEAYLELSNYNYEIGNIKQSFDDFKAYHNVLNELVTTKKNNQIEFLKASFKFQEIETELDDKEKLLEVLRDREHLSKKNNILLLLVFVIIIISLIFSFLRQKKLIDTRRKTSDIIKQQLKEKILFKNSQITEFAIHINEKNEVLENVKQRIKALGVESEKKKQVMETVNFINQNISANKEKIVLYSKIHETQESFLHNLSIKYASLSGKEKRIAVLLRLDLSSKQISTQLGLSINSVDTYRSSIRKKMEVPKTKRLKDFIKEI